MLDRLVAPTILEIQRSAKQFRIAEYYFRQAMTEHAAQLTMQVNDVLRAWHQECENVMRGDKPAPDPAATKNLLGSLLYVSGRELDVFQKARSLVSHEEARDRKSVV